MAVKIIRILSDCDDEICSYGCNQKAKYLLSTGKFCCGKSPMTCNFIKESRKLKMIEDDSVELCHYQCGTISKFKNDNGIYCCSDSQNKCPNMRLKNQKGISKNGVWNKGLTKDNDDRVKRNAIGVKRTRQKMSSAGELRAWNKGLTKDDDIRIAKYSINISKSKKGVPNYKNRKPISERRELCKSFINFKYEFKKVLWTNWTFPILQRDDFKCTICGSDSNLEVHHLKPYREIFIEAVENVNLIENEWLSWSDDQIVKLTDEILRLHPFEIGITVCRKCHSDIDPYRTQLIKG